MRDLEVPPISVPECVELTRTKRGGHAAVDRADAPCRGVFLPERLNLINLRSGFDRQRANGAHDALCTGRSFNPEPAATVMLPGKHAVAAGSGLNYLYTEIAKCVVRPRQRDS